ncbi:MAG: disulfide bond formation protein B [Paracoccaceae bacterium]
MTRNLSILVAAGGSAALLLGAFGFQFIGGLAPCHLCLLQRWPHAAAVLIGVLALTTGWRIWPWLGAVAAAATSGIGIYHAGVEWKWWQGPTSCTGSGTALSGLSGADLLSTSAPSGVVMCDQIAWQMWGISMAGWNAILSAVLVLVWIYAATRR